MLDKRIMDLLADLFGSTVHQPVAYMRQCDCMMISTTRGLPINITENGKCLHCLKEIRAYAVLTEPVMTELPGTTHPVAVTELRLLPLPEQNRDQYAVKDK